MKTYQQLADHIRDYAITRGKTKGNAPVNRVENSSREFIRYEAGEGSNIVGYQFGYTDNCKVFTMTPEGVLTVHGFLHACPSTYGFIMLAAGLHYRNKSFKGNSHQVVCASTSVGFYRAKKDMVFNPDGTCRDPVPFKGVRVDREATAYARSKLKAFTDLYTLWFTPEFVRSEFRISGVKDAALDESQWEDLCKWLKNCAHNKYVMPYWNKDMESWNSPKTHVSQILRKELTMMEPFDTGVYVLPVRT